MVAFILRLLLISWQDGIASHPSHNPPSVCVSLSSSSLNSRVWEIKGHCANKALSFFTHLSYSGSHPTLFRRSSSYMKAVSCSFAAWALYSCWIWVATAVVGLRVRLLALVRRWNGLRSIGFTFFYHFIFIARQYMPVSFFSKVFGRILFVCRVLSWCFYQQPGLFIFFICTSAKSPFSSFPSSEFYTAECKCWQSCTDHIGILSIARKLPCPHISWPAHSCCGILFKCA